MAPDVERGAEPVDVLGDAQLLDARLARGLQVALDVVGGEVTLGFGAGIIRALAP